jgi:hypothetical protein
MLMTKCKRLDGGAGPTDHRVERNGLHSGGFGGTFTPFD